MMYNFNNVVIEVSLYMIKLEREVGQEFVRMLGYGIDFWGYIICVSYIQNCVILYCCELLMFCCFQDGFVVNFEVIWVSMNVFVF